MTWEKSSLKCIREDIELDESLEGEEWEETYLTFSCTWATSVLSRFIAWEDGAGECARKI
jgi:hypothetical protein